MGSSRLILRLVGLVETEVDSGRELCEKLLAYSSPTGLRREIDPRTGRHLGNTAALTHLA